MKKTGIALMEVSNSAECENRAQHQNVIFVLARNAEPCGASSGRTDTDTRFRYRAIWMKPETHNERACNKAQSNGA